MKKWLLGMAILDLGLLLAACMAFGRLHGMQFLTATGIVDEGIDGISDEERSRAEERKRIALTFDDGPHPEYTVQLLDGLKERGVQATFFVTGEHASLHPDIIQRMHEEGHLIGNHTYNHVKLQSDNRLEFKKELLMTNAVLQEITGEEVLYVRPPYGIWDRSFEKELNMFPVLWTIDPTDWYCLNADTVTKRVVKKAKENAIILLHDYYQTSIEAALRIVDELQKEGYEFVTVDQVLLE